ncbi:hypothetical protein BKA69DRAFT_352378 [Paraphysoderma sedebokerense]|nr:hypothetical protein BKA69DRAFT_352378 [Paraphysoderma sedebokerense]
MFSKYTKSSVPSSPVLSDYPRNIPQQSSTRPSDFPNGHPNSAAQTNGENAAQLPNEESNARAPVKPPKKKIPRDPNAPKKPLSSYMLFCHDVRDKISEENPGINQQEVARIMGTLWKELPAEKKLEYDARYKAAKVVYDSEFAEYKHNKDSSAQPSSNPTAPSSAPQSQISPQTGPPTPTSTTAAAIPNSSRQPVPGQMHHSNEHNPSHPNSSTANSFAIQPSMLNNRPSEGGVGVLPWFTPMNNGGVNLGNFLYQDLYRQTPQGWPNPHGQGNPVREGGVSEGGRFPDMNHSVTQKPTNAPSPQQVAAAQRNSRRIGNPQDENLDGVDDDGGNMVQERGRKKRRKD